MESPIPPKELATILREVLMSIKSNPKRTPEMFNEYALKLRNELRGIKIGDAKKKVALHDAPYRKLRRPSNLTRVEISELRKFLESNKMEIK